MDSTVSLYLKYLKAALWPGSENLSEPDAAVMRLAREQATVPLVSRRREDELLSALAHQKLNEVLAKVVPALRERGIDSVLLKGQGLAGCYPKPEMRQCGDIDLYVGEANYEKAKEIVDAMAGKKGEESKKHYHIDVDGVPVELHRFSDVMADRRKNKIFQAASGEGLTRGTEALEANGVNVHIPEPTFNAYFIFHHLMTHFLSSGVGMRQFCDLAMFLHTKKESICSEKLSELLNKLGRMSAWQSVGGILVGYLGLPSEEFPFYSEEAAGNSEEILSLVFTDGNFGHLASSKRPRNEAYLKRKTNSLLGHISRFRKTRRLFPQDSKESFRSMICGGFAQVFKDMF